MLITRKTKVPLSWAFFAQMIIALSILGGYVVNAPFLYLIKRYIDNPALIMGLISIEVYITLLGGPIIAWLSDRIWSRFGRRLPFIVTADGLKCICLLLMPLAPNLWTLIILRWLFGAFGDFAAPAQALVNEIVPAKQRGISGGFLQAFMSLGNLVFFFLLIGRFEDVYFMGPFAFLTELSGATIMFWLMALVVLGVTIFQAVGIKETYPPGRKRPGDDSRPGEMPLWHFIKSLFRDTFAKDIWPIYLLLLAEVMFGFSLGVFGPLLFTEQWGYDLQTFGSNIAIGVPLAIVLGLLAGWLADRYGKMTLYVWGTVLHMIVQSIYTIYVFNKPDFRPTFWEIVTFGQIALIFGSIKGVAVGPLMWEYVKRNRMGAATSGIIIFRTLFKNTAALFVGVWLFLWSVWFFPQSGYNVTATFANPYDKALVEERLKEAGIDLSEYKLRPVHQPGIDSETSRRWWIHHNVDDVQDKMKQIERNTEQIGKLENKLKSPWVRDEKRAEFKADLERLKEANKSLEASLEAEAADLRERIAPLLADERFSPGGQLLSASIEENQLVIEALTIEPLPEDEIEELEQNLMGAEHCLNPDEANPNDLVPDIEVSPMPESEDGFYGVRYEACIDPRFEVLFDRAIQVGLTEDLAYELASASMALLRVSLGRAEDAFSIGEASAEAITISTDDGDEEPAGRLRFTLLPADGLDNEAVSGDVFAQAFEGLTKTIDQVSGEQIEGGYEIALVVDVSDEAEDLPYDEVQQRMSEFAKGNPGDTALLMVSFRKLAETIASPPLNITVPKHELEVSYDEREYEYFFSSQLLQIATDILGLSIVAFLIYLERKGTLTRYGAQEDEVR